ncbi:phosphatidate cytidylyltransferase [Bryobacter aggregatus]|uniref:phosphatidate cytidylyltransferase n=1 Tax=Bryobacter aggregatus TaxID=360054 RepID=UPI00068A54A9|nr:phosphatidate cytidylyltransferase [Bryobacter aggregatus]
MKRVLTALWLIPASTYSIFFAPPLVFAIVISVVAVLCYREYTRIVDNQGLASTALLGYPLGLLLMNFPGLAWYDIFLLAPIALAIGLRSKDLKTGFASSGAFALGLLYIFGAWRCGIALHERSAHWLFFAVALNWAGDISAYYTGRTFGKHKLAPTISPGKTIEGALGGILATVVFGCLYLPYFIPEISLGEAAILSILGNIAGQTGDLAESALKRGAAMKDSGTMLAGHGGWLDRLDSSLFSLPMVYWTLLAFQRWQ